jgi:hypothetical protein
VTPILCRFFSRQPTESYRRKWSADIRFQEPGVLGHHRAGFCLTKRGKCGILRRR